MDRTNDDDVPVEGFDPTNNMVDGLHGESDGTAEGDMRSAGERGDTGDPALGNSGQAPLQESPGGPPHAMP